MDQTIDLVDGYSAEGFGDIRDPVSEPLDGRVLSIFYDDRLLAAKSRSMDCV
jgi:hypothetical protein